MTHTQDQYVKLLANYAESLVDGMDMDNLVSFAMEQIEENIRRMFSLDEELIEEISRFYEETEVADMLKDDKPYLLVVNVEMKGMVFPMIPTGASVSEILLGD